jgi:glycosyltransferase involved in cell wall biosynthesis
LTDRVLWTDYTPPDQVTANFLASDVCVLPYRDGASYQRGTLMAALAHAMPIVTTTGRADRGTGVGGLPVLRDGENVLLVEPDNPHVLAEAIQRAGASPELRAKLSRGAREVADFFTWNRIAEKHLELYEKLTGQKQKAKGKT